VTGRPRVLLVQRHLEPPGGAAGVAAWMVEALKDDHAVTLLTWRRPDLNALNRFFGTTLRAPDLTVALPPAAVRAAVAAIPAPTYLLRTAILLRLAKRRAGDFDVLLTGDNEADFGPRGVQYINYPWDLLPRPVLETRWYHWRALVTFYRELCIRLAEFSDDRMRRTPALVSSDYVGRLVDQRYGLVPRTLYPPVMGSFPSVDWAQREPRTFLCVGRIAPDKQLDRVIDIMATVRAAIPDLRLRIVGTPEGAYAERIAARARAEGTWITMQSGLTRDALVALMARHRYGIHGHLNEHYGMVVAEMVHAGCIVWVPNDGGQVEIVGDARLRYDTVEGAAAAIVRTLRDPGEEAGLRRHLGEQARRFSTEHFVREFREVMAAAAGSGG
jgi:glycosyltransferase involved in cell wall biosynthesis